MASITKQQTAAANNALVQSLTVGGVAGLVAGSVFGVQMAVGGMLPMVAQMVGSQSVVVGFIVHMLISAIIGASFAVIAGRLPGTLLVQTAAGLGWGIVWWVLGALLIMPIVLGMGQMVFVIEEMQLMSLVGHGFFGVVLGVTYLLLKDRA